MLNGDYGGSGRSLSERVLEIREIKTFEDLAYDKMNWVYSLVCRGHRK